MSAHRRPRRPASPHPPLVVLLILVSALVGLGSVGLGLPASAVPTPAASSTDSSPSPGTDATTRSGDDDEPVSVQVMSVSPQVVRPGDELVVRARIRNDTEDPLESARARLRVNRFLQVTRSSVQQWVDQPLGGTAGSEVDVVPLARPLAPGASADVELRVPASGLGLSSADTAWGPRGLSVEVVDSGRRAGIVRTFVLWQPTDEPVTPTRVSVLVPLTGGPVDPTEVVAEASVEPDDDATPAPSSAEPSSAPSGGPEGAGSEEPTGDEPGTSDARGRADDTPGDADDAVDGTETPAAPTAAAPLGVPDDDALDRLEDVLEATAGQPAVTWAVDPALVAAARSPAASARARRWADELTAATTGREVVALPARDPDLAALAHAERGTDAARDEGAGTIAEEAWRRSRAAVDPVLGATPRADLAWPADDVPDLATVRLAARSGATAVVVAGEGLAAGRLTYTPSGRATLSTDAGDLAALVADPVLTAELGAPSDATPATAAQRVLAETAVIARERPSEPRHLVVTAPRGWDPEPAATRAQLAALGSVPWVELSGYSALVGAADPELDRTALPDRQVGADEIPPGDVAALLGARAELSTFAGIVADPSRLLAGADDAVLTPTSVAWRVDPVQRSLVVDGVVADLAARRTGVTAVPGSDLYLGSQSGRFPIGLRNDLDQDVTVQVAVDPASPVLVIDGAETVTITAGSETQVRVPFHAVGSGDVRVAVTLLSPDGAPLGPAQVLTVRVRADWENVGTAVVAGLLGLALVVGIIRTIRRGQTRNRGAGDTPVSEIARLPEDPT